MSFTAYSARQRLNAPASMSVLKTDPNGLPDLRAQWLGGSATWNGKSIAPDPEKIVGLVSIAELMTDASGVTWGLPNRNPLPYIIVATMIRGEWKPFAVYAPTTQTALGTIKGMETADGITNGYPAGYAIWNRCWRMPDTDQDWPDIRDGFLSPSGVQPAGNWSYTDATTEAERRDAIYSVFSDAVISSGTEPFNIHGVNTMKLVFGAATLALPKRRISTFDHVYGDIYPWGTTEFLNDHSSEWEQYLSDKSQFRQARHRMKKNMAARGYGTFTYRWWGECTVYGDPRTTTPSEMPGLSTAHWDITVHGCSTNMSAFLVHPFAYTSAVDGLHPGTLRLVSRTPEDGAAEAPLFPTDCPVTIHRTESDLDIRSLLYRMPHEIHFGTPMWRMEVNKEKFLEVFGVDLSDRDVYITEGLYESGLVREDIGMDLSGFPHRTPSLGLMQLSVPAGTTVQDLDDWSNVPGGYQRTRAWDVFLPANCSIVADADQPGVLAVVGAQLGIGGVVFRTEERLERGENATFKEVVEEGHEPVAGFDIVLRWVANLPGQLTRFKGRSVSEALDRVVVDRLTANEPTFQEPMYGKWENPDEENQEGQDADT